MLGKTVGPAPIARAREIGVALPPELDDPDAGLAPRLIIQSLRDVAGHVFPRLAAGPLD